MKKIKIKKIRLEDLVPHEQFRKKHKAELHVQIKKDKVLMRPIVVHDIGRHRAGKYMIIDGHHRTQVLKKMGLTYVPAHVLNYFQSHIVVRSWKGNRVWDKEKIIRSALKGKLLKPKSTKHVFVKHGKEAPFQDNDHVEPLIKYRLSRLK